MYNEISFPNFKNFTIMSNSKPTFQQNISHNSDPNQGISLCIPRVFMNIGWKRIKQAFIDADLGHIQRVDVMKMKNKDFKIAFVHFTPRRWNMRDAEARQALNVLQSGKSIRILYDEPYYWEVSISKLERPADAPHPKMSSKRKIKLDLSVPVKVSAETSTTSANMDDPVVARAMSSNYDEQQQVTDEDLEKYSHLSEQAATFMAKQDQLEEGRAPESTRQQTQAPL